MVESQTKTVVVQPLIGRTLGQYRVESLLGQGGMGIVFQAHDLKLQRAVALKLLSSELTSDADRKRRFLLEARAAARITHPAIAQVYDVDEHEGMIFIAMELVEGKTVRQLIQEKELDLLGAIDLTIQVAEGLAKAHAMGIVHRDIKPPNVILTRDGHAKILDFGIAKLMDPDESTTRSGTGLADLSTLTQTQVGAVQGTAAYMSPEQIKGQSVDARSDLFSLGVMLFEIVTGELPFHRGSLIEMMHAVAFEDTPSIHSRRPGLPVDLQRIISKCLRKRSEDRYPDARSLIQELRVLRRDTETGRARSFSFRERVGDALDQFRHFSPRQYAWLAGGVGAIALVVYLLLAGVGMGGFVFLLIGGLLTYRALRNQPQRLLANFVRKTARIPEVRLIICQDRTITVAVDRAVAQLYGRINDRLNECNRKRFFGEPLSVVIRPDIPPEEIQRLLSAPGVQYVREDSVPPQLSRTLEGAPDA